jgi:hypothetical protein
VPSSLFSAILAQSEAIAIKRVISYQLEMEMKAQNITKTKMAQLMNTSRASLNRLLDYTNPSVTLATLETATHVLGKKLNISIV